MLGTKEELASSEEDRTSLLEEVVGVVQDANSIAVKGMYLVKCFIAVESVILCVRVASEGKAIASFGGHGK